MSQYGMISTKYDESDTPNASQHTGEPELPETPKAPDTQAPAKERARMTRGSITEFFVVTTVLGCAVYGFRECMELYARLVKKTPLIDLYYTSELVFNVVQTFYTMFAVLLPFGIALILLCLILRKNRNPIPFEGPNDKKFFVAALGIAFMTMVVSNFVVGITGIGLEAIGFEIESNDLDPPQSVGGFFLQIISTALVPALCEEFAVRGVMLQTLRRYGDRYAILVSSLFFGLMHGNILQAPFAFFLGLVIGWLVLKTESIWTGIAIHFINNVYAVIIGTLYTYLSTGLYAAIAVALNILGIILGILGIIWVVDNKGKSALPSGLYSWQPYVFSLVSPAFIYAFAFFVDECLATITYVGIT